MKQNNLHIASILFLTIISYACTPKENYKEANAVALQYLNNAVSSYYGAADDSVTEADINHLKKIYGKKILPIDTVAYYALEADTPTIVIIPCVNVCQDFVESHFPIPPTIAKMMVNCYDITNDDVSTPNYRHSFSLYQKIKQINKEGHLEYVIEALIAWNHEVTLHKNSTLEEVFATALDECISNDVGFDYVDITKVVEGRILIGYEITDDTDYQKYQERIINQYYMDVYRYEKEIPTNEWQAFNYVNKLWEKYEDEEFEEEWKEIEKAIDELFDIL